VTTFAPATTLLAATPGTSLTRDNLELLPAPVAVPTYDRAGLTPAVVHIGVGDFPRAHQAVYFDDLARSGVSTEWGITGVGLRSPQMGEVLDGPLLAQADIFGPLSGSEPLACRAVGRPRGLGGRSAGGSRCPGRRLG